LFTAGGDAFLWNKSSGSLGVPTTLAFPLLPVVSTKDVLAF